MRDHKVDPLLSRLSDEITLCTTLETPRDIIYWIQVTISTQHFEVEGLKLEAPVLNSRSRVGLGSRAVENGSQRFVIRYDFEVTSKEVHTEVMTTPCDCQCLVLDLRVKPSHTREGFAGVGNLFATLS